MASRLRRSPDQPTPGEDHGTLRGSVREDVLLELRIGELQVPVTYIWAERDGTADPSLASASRPESPERPWAVSLTPVINRRSTIPSRGSGDPGSGRHDSATGGSRDWNPRPEEGPSFGEGVPTAVPAGSAASSVRS